MTAANPEWDTALGVTVPIAARVTGAIYDPNGERRQFDHWYELFHYRQTVHGASVFEVGFSVKLLFLTLFCLNTVKYVEAFDRR